MKSSLIICNASFVARVPTFYSQICHYIKKFYNNLNQEVKLFLNGDDHAVRQVVFP